MVATTITVARSVAGSPGAVFADWTEADRLATWWWPHLPGTTYAVDARPGGRYRIHSPVIGATVSGTFSEVDPPRRLALTWVWQDDGEPESASDILVVSVEPVDEGSAVTVAHTSAAHAPDGATEQGWNDVLSRLVERYDARSTSSRS
jgi:uncharacterized protein YndB with AHSA1/START domain